MPNIHYESAIDQRRVLQNTGPYNKLVDDHRGINTQACNLAIDDEEELDMNKRVVNQAKYGYFCCRYRSVQRFQCNVLVYLLDNSALG